MDQSKQQNSNVLISKIIQSQEKPKQQLIVDAESGPFKTIQEAIKRAEPGSIIKIAPGLYQDNIIINVPDLTLEPKEQVGDIILVVKSRPAILVDLKPNEKCTIFGMKMSHSGTNEEVERIEKIMEEKAFTLSIFGQGDAGVSQDGQNSFAKKLTPEMELVNKFPIDQSMNCILLVHGGQVTMEECLLSLHFIESNKSILPAVVVEEGANLTMNKVEVKGNKNFDTIGILSKMANTVIKECKIYNHLQGGVLIWGTKKNTIEVVNSKIVFNTRAGVHVVGEDNNCLIEGNKIENNNGPGIKIGIANKSTLVRNEIKQNQIGIEVISGDPFIFSNKIDKNYTDGILTTSYKNLRCDSRIKTNLSIAGNKENGIHCQGINNFTKIEQNSFIGYNKKAGIKIDQDASVSIYKNKISKNIGQGILLVESSQSIVEKNEISDNIKANIALGGKHSVNTYIIENRIQGGRCEGIFMIEGGDTWILRNTIQENNDGIVCVQSTPEIQRNIITKNKSNGIMLLTNSCPKILDNLINDNDGIGLFIRDKSRGLIKKNIIKSNEIELVLEKRNAHLDDINKDNQISGDIRIPSNFECNIF